MSNIDTMYIVLCITLALVLITAVIISLKRTQLRQQSIAVRRSAATNTNVRTVPPIRETTAVIVTNPVGLAPDEPVVLGMPV